jgi:hypothetical protein
MVTHGIRITLGAILLTGMASHAAAQQNNVSSASDSYPTTSFTDALDTYAAARSAFDQKEYSAAVIQFERTLALLHGAEKTASSIGAESAAADLALLTTGFLDLSRALAGDPQRESPASRPRHSLGAGGLRLARAASRASSPGASL